MIQQRIVYESFTSVIIIIPENSNLEVVWKYVYIYIYIIIQIIPLKLTCPLITILCLHH